MAHIHLHIHNSTSDQSPINKASPEHIVKLIVHAQPGGSVGRLAH